ncbi:glycosyltransferase family 4 protein [Streptomyces indicus]|uniref:Glycosyltransferase involved in cell wall bisynthesis n=1 Tax=Streptomyces indicus TaxID=417292 RepID=A0A1G9CI15_9ACTN|nr:glycosyltransferase family 4 protein [Streptomyces indicus]SDK51292.1 Glycosyltransferase involved in cell wall bisynthesis [Streptomyces indicus]
MTPAEQAAQVAQAAKVGRASHATKARIAYVLPYLTAYRVPFLEHLTRELSRRGVELTVAHGRATGISVARGDELRMPGAVELRQRRVEVRGRELVWHHGLGALARTHDALVVPQTLHNLRVYPLLARRRVPVGLWGHGHTHVSAHTGAEHRAKAALTRWADWFFAYTEAGGQYARRAGLPAERITVVQNTLDTVALTAARDQVSAAEAQALRARYGLTAGRTGLFIGAVDELKRIPFLLAAAERIAGQLPGFRLLVAGTGEQRTLVESCPAAVYVGPVDAGAKARLGAVSDVLLMPGAVGLCAVDSFALRTPLVTTPWRYHGPEFGYLAHGRNALVVEDAAYADAVVQLLCRPRELARLRRACRCDAQRYTVEEMALRFARGAEGLLALAGQRRRSAPRRPRPAA